MKHRRIAVAALTETVSDPEDRYVMPMSTFVASDEWLGEVSWDGCHIGDLQIFHNANVRNGHRTADGDVWVWWNGVPAAKVKSYRFAEAGDIRPMTVNAERETESRSPARGTQAAARAPQL